MLPDVRHAGAGLDRAGRSCRQVLPEGHQAAVRRAALAMRPPGGHLASLAPGAAASGTRLVRGPTATPEERAGARRRVPAWSAPGRNSRPENGIRSGGVADRPADRLRTPFEVSLADDPKAVDMDSEAPTLAKALAVAGKLISRIAGPHLPATARPPGPWRPTISRGSRPADAAPPDTHPGRRTQAAWTGGRTARGSRGSRATRAARRRTGPRPGCR